MIIENILEHFRNELQQQCSQLLKTIQTKDDNQIQLELELDKHTSAAKRLYSHFKIPFDSIQTIDQLIPILEDQYRTEHISKVNILNFFRIS